MCIKLSNFIYLILIKNIEFELFCLHLSHIVPIPIEMPREFISTKSLTKQHIFGFICGHLKKVIL